MQNVTRGKLLLACAACFLAGWLGSQLGPTNLLADPTSTKKAEGPAVGMSARLGGNVYLQRSAEYRACCYTIYKSAELRLEAALERARPKLGKPAVVMDLDETVLDNSAFQTFLYRNNLEYTDQLWAEYEENYPQDVLLVPGAKQFIEKAEAWGVTVIFLSNRSERYQKSTEAALERLGISATNPAGRLYLKPKDQVSSEKSTRREAIAAKYNVLLYFGDNLRDFSEAYAAPRLSQNPTPEDYLKAIKQRAAVADDAVCHWGVDWFVLPNPVYGEWDKLIGPEPLAILQPTSMKGKTPAPK